MSDVEAETSGDEGTATFRATLGLQGLGTWTYDGELVLVRVDGEWRARPHHPSLHPAVPEGGSLRRHREQGPRAAITAVGGQPLAVGGAGGSGRQYGLAGSLLGGVRAITAPEAAAAGLEYAAGDLVGVEGVEEGFEDQLAGDPAGRIEAVDSRGAVVEVVAQFGSESPEPLELTIDYVVQRAAEQALADVTLPTALVAIDSTTGAIRAVANNPPGFDRALLGEYPPGSTFKIVTAAALLGSGLPPDQVLRCPVEVQVGDAAVFSNAFGEDYGDLPFIDTFAKSCNTTFVEQAYERLGATRLYEAAQTFGFNQVYDLGIPVAASDFPLPETDTELAASAIGQARVTVTPLHMASVAAAGRNGTWRPPYLAGEPPEEGSHPLPEAAVEHLPELMREVVRSGTGQAVAILGRDIGGKTGTAEFGDEDPPETHAWFAGFVGDLAYAVVVEGGGVGGEVAAPIAREFLGLLPPPPAGPGGLPGTEDGTDQPAEAEPAD